MSFILPDLVIESIIRDGLENARRDESVIDDVFGNLTRSFASEKYGQGEVEKIKKMMRTKEISIVHSFHVVDANVPCISIQLLSDTEDETRAHIGDYTGTYDIPFSTPEEIAGTIIVSSFTPTAYDTKSGAITVPDAVNLSPVYSNLIFCDAAGTEHCIVGGIVNVAGKKQFVIPKNSVVDLGAGAEIKTSINFARYNQRGNVEKVQLMLGIHTKDALTTKYVYTLVKYFLLSRKKDLITRDFQLSTYNGSDFHRNLEYKADVVFTRFINISGMLQHDWRSDKVDLIDNVEVNVVVPADEYGNSVLDLEDQTVKVNKD